MNTARSPVLPTLARHVRLPATREAARALLSALDGGPFEPESLAEIVGADPAMVLALLAAIPLDSVSAGFDLQSTLALRVGQLGPDLLKVYALSELRDGAESGLLPHHALHALFVAEYAMHLATETRAAEPQQSYLAGLVHDVGQLWLDRYGPSYEEIRGERIGEKALAETEFLEYASDHCIVGAKIARRAGFPPPVADAVQLHHALPEVLATAHPLARLVWVAENVSGYQAGMPLDALLPAAELAGLDPGILVSLSADVSYLVGMVGKRAGLDPAKLAAHGERPRQLPAVRSSASGALALAGGGEDAVMAAALAALSRAAFADCDDALLDLRFAAACRLLAGAQPPLVFVLDGSGRVLRSLPDARFPWAATLGIPADDSASVVALALRTSTTTRQRYRSRGPRGSAADWQLARWLGGAGVLCEPWGSGRERGVAVFGSEESEQEGRVQAILRRSLVDAMTRRTGQRRAAEAQQRNQAEALRLGYRFHAERIAGEAKGPLAMIREQLGRMTRPRRVDPTLDEALNGLQREIERVGELLDAVTEPPPLESVGVCHVAEAIQELRVLHADELFGDRRIQLEVRLGVRLPAVAVPHRVVTEVLLGLFRFAAHRLPPGTRYAVATASPFSVNGKLCGEVRLIDNGPALSLEDVQALFAEERGPGGVGQLGALQAKLAEHGASLICRSQPGTGTAFQLCLPLSQPDRVEAAR